MSTTRIGVWLAVLVLTSWCRAADETPSGLYAMSWEGPGRAMKRADTDGHVMLGKSLSPMLRDASLVSLNNDNSLFRLSVVAGPISEGGGKQQMAIVVAGLCVPVGSHQDPAADGSISVSGTLAGEDAAAKVASELGVKPKLREHPGHRFVVSVKPEKPSYQPREPVTLVMTIENVGTTTVRFYDGGSQRGPRNNQFGFTAYRTHGFGRAVPDTGDPTNFGGIAGLQTLAPRETFTKTANLSDWFTFDAADSYLVIAIYRLTLGDDSHRSLWDDFAVATCTVRVDAEAGRDHQTFNRSMTASHR